MNRFKFILCFGLLSLVVPQTEILAAQGPGGFTHPDWSPDGRKLVAENLGDLWVFDRIENRWTRLTQGTAIDRDPVWGHGGDTVLFSSNRSQSFCIWTIDVATGSSRKLTADGAFDTEPVSLSSGAILFTRGRGPESRLFHSTGETEPIPVTGEIRGERSASVSSDGKKIVYVADNERGSGLRIWDLEEKKGRWLQISVPAEKPRWAPDDRRIVFASARPRGLWITREDGLYVNWITGDHAEHAWNTQTGQITLARIMDSSTPYNGDPDRLALDPVVDFADAGPLLSVPAPQEVTPTATDYPAFPAALSAEVMAEQFDRVWARLRDLYFHRPHNAAPWDRLRDKYAPRVRQVTSSEQLQDLVFAMLAERPTILPEAVGSRAAIASAHPAATDAGIRILSKGGNVVDAAVAVSFALGVVEPDASGIGGYGQMLLYLKGSDGPRVIEFLTRLPAEAGLTNPQLSDRGGFRPRYGRAVVNVPGTVAGMYLAWTRYGSKKLPWRDLLEPAIQLAEKGFPIDDGLATTLFLNQDRYRESEAARALFFRAGKPLRAGAFLENKELSWVLRTIAEKGADGFYRGDVASKMVEDLRRGGNLMTMEEYGTVLCSRFPPPGANLPRLYSLR